jgi:hypothetical protein
MNIISFPYSISPRRRLSAHHPGIHILIQNSPFRPQNALPCKPPQKRRGASQPPASMRCSHIPSIPEECSIINHLSYAICPGLSRRASSLPRRGLSQRRIPFRLYRFLLHAPSARSTQSTMHSCLLVETSALITLALTVVCEVEELDTALGVVVVDEAPAFWHPCCSASRVAGEEFL